jgi:hypothetical protein
MRGFRPRAHARRSPSRPKLGFLSYPNASKRTAQIAACSSGLSSMMFVQERGPSRRHVWMAPLLQEFFGVMFLAGCGHVYGVCGTFDRCLDAIHEPAPDHRGGPFVP